MKIIHTTDGKYVGKEIKKITNPLVISEDLTFHYDKKIEVGEEIVLANSNYIINITK